MMDGQQCTGRYKVAFSLRLSTAVARPQLHVCKRGGLSKKTSIEGVLRLSTAVTDVRCRSITQWECYLTKQTHDPRSRGGGKSDRKTVRTEGAAKHKHVLSRFLSFHVTRPSADCIFCTLRDSQMAN